MIRNNCMTINLIKEEDVRNIRKIRKIKMVRITKENPEYFWNNVDIKGKDECWVWKGYAYTHKKYKTDIRGMVIFNGKTIQTHRISWILTYGYIPKGMSVCHRCDNTICANPNHLFLGTQHDNIQDCVKKGRRNNGKKIIMIDDDDIIRLQLDKLQ